MPFNYLDIPRKSKRSQSALEYMMTYGWAILIIVIVAVILYSMGIFNPSSSITFTSSGFSPFTVSSSLCNNIGYKIAVLAGPIPNNANSLTINKVFLTSATGANTTTASYTLTNPVTLKSGQSATILIPNVACNSANIHYSLSAKIQYSYTASTLGLQNVNTTGTIAGTSITGKPLTLTSYEPITITNTQSSATPSPFQQMINFTSSDPGFSSIATGNFGQNVEFFYYNGTVIQSWLENYTSTNATWWLKIAAIPGGSSETVYVGFAPRSVNLFNNINDGEAPQIPCGSTPTSSCSNYAEYDDGVNVFESYNNFSGTQLDNTEFQVSAVSGLSGGTVVVKNGLSIVVNTTDAVAVLTKKKYPLYNKYFGFGAAPPNWPPTNFALILSNGVIPGIPGFIYFDNEVVVTNDSYHSLSSSVTNTISNSIYLFLINNNTQQACLNTNFVNVICTSLNNYPYTNPSYIGLLNSWKGNETFGPIYYFFISFALPNGVMPSVSFDRLA